MKTLLRIVQVAGLIAVLVWLLMVVSAIATRAQSSNCIEPDGRIENMTIILDHQAFPPSFSDREVLAIGETGECYGRTVLQPGKNTALAVWGAGDYVAGGIEVGEKLNISLEYYPDSIIAITTAARDTTLSEIIDILTLQVAGIKAQADSLQGLVDNFPDPTAEISRLTLDLARSDSLNSSLRSEIAGAFRRLAALSELLNN